MHVLMITIIFTLVCSAYLSIFIGEVFWMIWNIIGSQFFELVHIPLYQWFIISFVISIPFLWRKIKKLMD